MQYQWKLQHWMSRGVGSEPGRLPRGLICDPNLRNELQLVTERSSDIVSGRNDSRKRSYNMKKLDLFWIEICIEPL